MGGVLCPVVCGRDDELRVLRNAFAQAADGRGGVVFITGEPGIGKSRLVRELTGHARGLGAMAATGRAVRAGRARRTGRSREALLQLLRDRPLTAHADFDPWLPALRAILPALGQPDQEAAAEPRTAAARLAGRPGRGGDPADPLARCRGRDGLVIALEDLHWADPDTLAVLEYLADNVGGERVMFVATSRDEPDSDGRRPGAADWRAGVPPGACRSAAWVPTRWSGWYARASPGPTTSWWPARS